MLGLGGSAGIKDLGALQCHDKADYIASNVVCLSIGHTHPERIHDPFSLLTELCI